MSIFVRASKLKLRFATTKGALSTEELWDLSLESLDVIAKKVNKELKDTEEESFIGKKTSANTLLNLKLEILKYVIQVKLEEKDKATARAEKNAKLARLKDLYANKADAELEGKSKEEIAKMIEELGEEDSE